MDSSQYRNRKFFPFSLKCFVQKLWHNTSRLPRAAPHPSAFFHKIRFYASFEAYCYVFTAETTGLWKTARDSLAQTREMAQIYRSRILIVPPTNAYKQYKYITSARVGSQHCCCCCIYIYTYNYKYGCVTCVIGLSMICPLMGRGGARVGLLITGTSS